jgi:hypothetical protein
VGGVQKIAFSAQFLFFFELASTPCMDRCYLNLSFPDLKRLNAPHPICSET